MTPSVFFKKSCHCERKRAVIASAAKQSVALFVKVIRFGISGSATDCFATLAITVMGSQ